MLGSFFIPFLRLFYPDGSDLGHAVGVFMPSKSLFLAAIFKKKSLAPIGRNRGKENIMATIKYEINGKLVDFEVSEEFAQTYNDIINEEYRAEERHKWELRKRVSSLDLILELGGQIEDPDSNFADEYGKYDDLHKALSLLLPEQQELIHRIYVDGESQADIAKSLGVCKQAINNRLQRILENLKKTLI